MGESLAARLGVFVLLTLWCHGPASPLLPAAYEPILLTYGRLYPPLMIAVVGALASTAVEYLNYHLYRRLLAYDALDRAFRSPSARRVVRLFSQRPFLTVWLCVWSPLPDWAARILASHSGYSVNRYLAAFLLARLPRFWFLAALGFHLQLGIGPILGLIVGSVLVTLVLRRGSGFHPVAALQRHRRSPENPSASRARSHPGQRTPADRRGMRSGESIPRASGDGPGHELRPLPL